MVRVRTVLVACPICKGTLEVNAENGKVLRHFPYKKKSEDHDQLAEALEEVKKGTEKAEEKFKSTREKEKYKLDRLEKEFHKKKREVEESGDTERPIRDIDLY